MIDVWDFYIGERVRITTDENEIFVGDIICILSADELEEEEDSIDLETDTGFYGFNPSMIKKIEILNEE